MGSHVTSPTFVGRGAELGVLLDELRAGGPRCVLLSGEAGVGKTRLVGEFARRATDDGAARLTGRCIPAGDQLLPLAPLMSILRDLAKLLSPDDLSDVLGPAGPELARLVPDIGEEPSVGDPPSPGRLFELFLGVLTRLAGRRPVVCVFEDVHWADTSSRELFGFLARSLRVPVVLLATYRGDELHRQHPLRPFLAELRRAVQPTEVALRGLSPAETTELLAEVRGERPTTELAAEVHRLTGGNAFFAEELAATGTVSDSLRDVLVARAAPLDKEAFRLLCVAAAAGAVDADGVVVKVAGVASDDAESLLADIAAAGLLVADRDRWRFRHELAREVFEGELSPGERVTVHRALAAAIEEQAPDRAARISWHLAHAGDQAGALEWSVRAARDFERIGAMAEAHEAYERALAAWEAVPDATERTGCSHPNLLLAAADAASLANRFERPVDLAELAIDELADDPLAAGAAWTKLAGYRLFCVGRGRMDEAMERALELIPAEPPSPERAWAMARYGGVLGSTGRYDESLRVSREALGAARAVGHEFAELYALHTVGMCVASLGDARGLAAMREALEQAIAAGSAFNIGRGYWNLGVSLCQYERYDESIALAAEGRKRLADLGLGRREGVGVVWHLLSALARTGRWTELDDELASLCDLLGDDGVRAWDMAFAVPRAVPALRRGRVEEAREVIAGAVEDVAKRQDPEEELGRVTLARIELGVHDGTWETLRSVVEDAIDDLADQFPVHVPSVVAAAIGAEAEHAAARRARADGPNLGAVDRWLRRAEVAARRYAGTDLEPVVAIWRDQADAERGRLVGRSDPSAWEQIAAGWDTRGRPYEAAYARLRAAEALLVASGTRATTERDQAAILLREAHAVAVRLGAVRLIDHSAWLARHARITLGADTDGADGADDDGATAVPFGLTERELQVFALVAAGRTNREIAAELFISAKTASVHVSNILRKVSATNRVEAAAIAHRLGITAQAGSSPR